MADLINLNQARKTRAKADAEATASANRIKYGRSKQRKLSERVEADRARRALDDVKREP